MTLQWCVVDCVHGIMCQGAGELSAWITTCLVKYVYVLPVDNADQETHTTAHGYVSTYKKSSDCNLPSSERSILAVHTLCRHDILQSKGYKWYKEHLALFTLTLNLHTRKGEHTHRKLTSICVHTKEFIWPWFTVPNQLFCHLHVASLAWNGLRQISGPVSGLHHSAHPHGLLMHQADLMSLPWLPSVCWILLCQHHFQMLQCPIYLLRRRRLQPANTQHLYTLLICNSEWIKVCLHASKEKSIFRVLEKPYNLSGNILAGVAGVQSQKCRDWDTAWAASCMSVRQYS